MRVSWRPAARDDLLDLYLYIAERGAPEAALRYAGEIEAFADAIGHFPRSGRARDDIRPGLRMKPFRSVLVAYEIREDAVHVLRILHAARDYARLLEGNGE